MNAVIYCDGSAPGVRGPGGVGYVGTVGDVEVEASQTVKRATNQQAEILAAAFALQGIGRCDHVIIWSDSQYLVRGWGWLPGWIARGWRTKSGRVANIQYWHRLQAAVAGHGQVEFKWVRGHDGNVGNERADALAQAARIQSERDAA